MWECIKSLFSNKKDKEEKEEDIVEEINDEELTLSSKNVISEDGKLFFRFFVTNGKKYDLNISYVSSDFYDIVLNLPSNEKVGICYLKNENYFKNEYGTQKITGTLLYGGSSEENNLFIRLIVENINISDFLDKSFTKCRLMCKRHYEDIKIDKRFNIALTDAVKDLIDKNEILTVNPTKGL